MDYEEVARRQEQTYQPDPSGTRLIPVGEEHHHDQKKPVLKKVKDKVKKIKDTLNIKKPGHGDEHDRDDDNDTSEEEKEEGYEEDNEENIQDPEVHGAPVYDTPAAQEFTTGQESKEPPQKVNLGSMNPTFQEDPAAPKTETLGTADQNRATQPPPTRGGEEIETSPVIQYSFEAMTISDQPHVQKEEEVEESTPPTGTNDQFSPTAAPASEDNKLQSSEEPKGPSYTEKLSTTAAAAKSAAMSAAAGSTEYGKKIASTVYETVSEAGTAVKEKVQQKTSETTETDSGDPTATKGMGVSMREYLAEKLRPGEEDKALSEVISEAFHKRNEEAEQGLEVTGSGSRAGEGLRVVEKIRGAVTSLVGGGGGSRASPARESAQAKGEEEQKETQQEPEGQKQEE